MSHPVWGRFGRALSLLAAGSLVGSLLVVAPVAYAEETPPSTPSATVPETPGASDSDTSAAPPAEPGSTAEPDLPGEHENQAEPDPTPATPAATAEGEPTTDAQPADPASAEPVSPHALGKPAPMGITPMAAGDSVVSGTVTGPDDEPLTGVNLIISCLTTFWTDSTWTDASGGFAFTVSVSDKCDLRVSYPDTGEDLVVKPDWVQLTLDGSSTTHDFHFVRPGSISGVVLDRDGAPLANVDVYAEAADGSEGADGSGYTGPDGTFTIDWLYPQEYRVLLSAWGVGLADEYLPGTFAVASSQDTSVGEWRLGLPGSITGVVQLVGGAAATGAKVSVLSLDDPDLLIPTVTVGAGGSFTVGELDSGEYLVKVAPPAGSDLLTQWWQQAKSQNDATSVHVDPGTPTNLGTITLTKGERISGVITGLGGQPVPDAWVVLYQEDGISVVDSTTSSSSGAYSFEVEPGSYYLKISPDSGYKETWWPGSADQDQAEQIVVDAGQTVVADVHLSPGRSLYGTISYLGGGPVADASIVLLQGDDWIADATTESDGSYFFGGLDAGTYDLDITFGNREHLERGVLVGDDDEPYLHDVAVDPGKSISGSVVNGTKPISGATVSVRSKAGEWLASATTNASGVYTIAGLSAGTVTVSAYAEGMVGRYLGDKTNLREAEFFQLTADVTGKNINLAGAVVTGTITGSDGAKVASALIELVDRAGNANADTYANAQGVFSFDSVPAGQYALRVFDDQGKYAVGWWDGSADRAHASYFTVGAGASVTKNVTLSQLVAVTGKVTLTGPAGSHSVGVEAYRQVEGALQFVDDAGAEGPQKTYTLRLPAGSYLLKFIVWPESGPRVESWWQNASTSAAATPVVVGGAGQPVELSTVTLNVPPLPTGSVAGQVNAPGADMSELTVYLSSADEFYAVEPDAGGSFLFQYVAPGNYTIQVSSYDDHVASTYYPSVLDEAAAGVVTVGTTAVTGLTVTMVAYNASLAGRVTAQAGQLDWAWLEIYRVTPADPYGEWAGYANVDDDGYYDLGTRLVIGQQYRVVAGGAGNTSAEKVITAAATNTVDLQLAVASGTSLRGQVLDDANEPAKNVWAVLVDDSGSEIDSARTKADGSYGFDELRAGAYKVRFGDYSSSESYFAPRWVGGIYPSQATSITLQEGQARTVDTVALSRSAKLYGAAYATVGGSRTWIEDANVTLSTAAGEVLAQSSTGTDRAPGTFAFAVPAGSYRVCASPGYSGYSGLTTACKDVSVVAGANTDVGDLDLTAAVTPAIVPGTPTITGTAMVGQTLTANPGTWAPTPVTLAYQWRSGGSAVGTGATYVIGAGDVGKTITVTVTGTKAGYITASKSSAATSAVVPVPAPTLSAGVPSVTGSGLVGSVLTVGEGSWSPAPGFAYQWKRNGSAIAGATGRSYTVGVVDLGASLSVTVTGSLAGYPSVSRDAVAVSVNATAGTKFTKSVAPTISGKAKVGSKLTAKVKAWKPKSSGFGFQWYRNGQPIAGATGSSYVIRPEDAGGSFKVRVAGLLSGYQPLTKDSKATKKVPVPSVTAGKVSVSGKAKVGTTLTVKVGAWKPAPVVLGYQWLRNGKAIAGATGSTYTLTTVDVKAKVSVRVTGSKAWFKSVVKTSKKTGKVKA